MPKIITIKVSDSAYEWLQFCISQDKRMTMGSVITELVELDEKNSVKTLNEFLKDKGERK